MKKRILFLIAFFSFSLCAAQETEAVDFKGIHQLESEAHAHDSRLPILAKTTDSIRPLADRPVENALTHAVFGYLPYWERDATELDYSALSHLAVFDFHVSASTGKISSTPSGWPNDWIHIINDAHDAGTKVIMCVTEFNNDDIHAIITSSTRSAAFYADVVSYINTWLFDGVNIDFEGVATADRGDVMNNFMQGLSDYVHTHAGADKEVSFAGPAVNWSSWKLKELTEACDYVFIMGYAYYYNGSSTTGPSAPVQGSTHNLEQTLISRDKGYGQADRSKLILGLPYYGNRWEVSSSQRNTEKATTLSTGKSIFYYSTMTLYEQAGKKWSSNFYDAWCSHQTDGKWYQSWCNDAKSINAKHQLVFEYDLMGTGMWALNYDAGRQELWDLLKTNFMNASDTIILDDFSQGKGNFDTPPEYSGSTHGISSASYTDWWGSQGDSCLALYLYDDPSSDLDWKVRLLSGRGNPIRNTSIPRERNISFRLKSAASCDLQVAVMIDDSDGHEISDTLDVICDDLWHNYSVDFRPAENWNNYSGGNGSLEADFLSLDALMFFSHTVSDSICILIDDLRSTALYDSLSYTVSGYIRCNHSGIPYVTVGNTLTDETGFYSMTLPYASTVDLIPEHDHYCFEPDHRNINLLNLDLNWDFTAELTVSAPSSSCLAQSYPNPCSDYLHIPFTLDTTSYVLLDLYDCVGHRVTSLLNREFEAGHHLWEGNLPQLPSGVYIYRLRTENVTETKKLVLIH